MSNSLLQKYTILIVDDEPSNISLLNELLKHDYKLKVANNAVSALKVLHKSDLPDLVLLDIVMPDVSGYDLCRDIKKDDRLKNIPVIFLSGKTDTAEIVKGFKLGAVDYVRKPFQPEELLTRVETHLSLLETKRELERTNKDLYLRNREIEAGMETALMLQQNLLPKNRLDIRGFDSHYVYIPMDTIGGDLYDYTYNNSLLSILIADVCGHGLSGALYSTIAKVAFQNISDKSDASAVLQELNKVIYKYSVQGNFITAFYCVIDIETGRMNYASAGHCPMFLLKKDTREVVTLKTKGYMLGIDEDMKSESDDLFLKKNDRIILYTDGVIETERSNEGKIELWGEKRLIDFSKKNCRLGPEEFCANLVTEIFYFSESELMEDDITLAVLDVNYNY